MKQKFDSLLESYASRTERLERQLKANELNRVKEFERKYKEFLAKHEVQDESILRLSFKAGYDSE